MAGELHETCGQSIAASFGPAERKLPPDRTALDVDDAEFAAAQFIDDRRHRHDGHGVAVAHETLDALGTAQLHHYTQRSESYIRRREVFRNHFEGSRTAFTQHQGHRLQLRERNLVATAVPTFRRSDQHQFVGNERFVMEPRMPGAAFDQPQIGIVTREGRLDLLAVARTRAKPSPRETGP